MCSKIRRYVLSPKKMFEMTDLYYGQNICIKNKTSWVLLAEFMLTSLTFLCYFVNRLI